MSRQGIKGKAPILSIDAHFSIIEESPRQGAEGKKLLSPCIIIKGKDSYLLTEPAETTVRKQCTTIESSLIHLVFDTDHLTTQQATTTISFRHRLFEETEMFFATKALADH